MEQNTAAAEECLKERSSSLIITVLLPLPLSTCSTPQLMLAGLFRLWQCNSPLFCHRQVNGHRNQRLTGCPTPLSIRFVRTGTKYSSPLQVIYLHTSRLNYCNWMRFAGVDVGTFRRLNRRVRDGRGWASFFIPLMDGQWWSWQVALNKQGVDTSNFDEDPWHCSH